MKSILNTLLAIVLLLFVSCLEDQEFPNAWDEIPADKELVIRYPNATTTYNFHDSSAVISWMYRGEPYVIDNLSLYLLVDDTIQTLISESVPHDLREYNWLQLFRLTQASTKCQLILTANPNIPIADTSEYFTVESPYNGAYTIAVINDFTSSDPVLSLQWEASGTLDNYVDIHLYKNGEKYVTITEQQMYYYIYDWYLNLSALPLDSTYQIRVTNRFDPRFFVMSNTFLIQGTGTNDLFEPDNTPLSASILTLNSQQDHSLIYNDTDWVKIAVETGLTYALSIGNSGYAHMELYNHSGTMDTIKDSGSLPRLIFTAQTTDTLTARITPHNSSSTTFGMYSLIFQEYTPSNAVAISSPAEGTTWPIQLSRDIKWNVLYDFDYATIELYNNGSLLDTITDLTSNDGLYNWTISKWYESGDNYQVRISDTNSDTLFALSAPFAIQGVQKDQYEPNPTFITASTVEQFDTLQTLSLSQNDTDWIAIPTMPDNYYSITIDSDQAFNITSKLYKTDTTELLDSSLTYYSSVQYNYKSNDTEMLYVMITSMDKRRGGSYSFTVTQSTREDLIQISSPTLNSNHLIGENLNINWHSSSINDNIRIVLQNTQIPVDTIITVQSRETSLIYTLPLGLETGDAYKIRIESTVDSTLYAESAIFSVTGILNDDLESNDTELNATAIATFPFEDSLMIVANGSDFFSVQMKEKHVYTVQVSSPTNLSLDLHQSTSADSAIHTNYYQEQLSFKVNAIVDEPLIFNISNQSNYLLGGLYTISITESPIEEVFSFTSPTNSSIFADSSQYEINWKAGLTIDRITLDLYNDTNLVSSIRSGITNTGSTSWFVPEGLATSSQYRVKISDYSNPKLSLFSDYFSISGVSNDLFEPDNENEQARVITFPHVKESHSLPLNDSDYVSFTGIKGNLYAFTTTTHDSVLLKMSIYESTTAESLVKKVTDTLFWFCSENGNYSLKIEGALNSTVSKEYEFHAEELLAEQYGIEMLTPALNSVVIKGSISDISWTPSAFIGESVDIFIFKSGQLQETIISDTPNNGTYSWTASSLLVPGNDYSIAVVSRLESLIRGSTALFTIQ